MKIYLYILFSLLLAQSLSSQDIKTILILDRQNYGTGEMVQGFVAIEGCKLHNKSFRLEVTSISTGENVFQTSLKVKDNGATFYIPVTSDLRSGTYAVEIFACTVENVTNRNIVHVATSNFNVVNTGDSKLSKESFFEIKNGSLPSLTKGTLNINTKYVPTDKSFNISLASSTSDTLRFMAAIDNNTINISEEIKAWNPTTVNAMTEKLFYVLNVSDDKSQKQFGLVGLYSENADKLFISKSDANGAAIFLFDDYEGSHGFNLFVYQNYSAKSISNLKNVREKYSPVSESQWIKIQDEAQDILKRENIHHYFEVNTFVLKNPMLMKKHAAPKPYANITPSTYKKFPDLQTFCKENSLELRFRTNKDKVTTTLSPPPRFTNTYEKIEWENPFFIIDGKVENDYKKIASMKPEDILSLQIFYDKKEVTPWMYAFGSNGVVKIETKNKINSSSQLRINGYQNQFTDHQSLIAEAKTNNKPILIPTLFWKSKEDVSSPSISVMDNADKMNKSVFLLYSSNNKLYLNTTELKYTN